jgi:hypothetical protein
LGVGTDDDHTRRRRVRGGEGLGPYWGARYTRTWFTTLAGLPVLWGIYFSVLGGTQAWVVLVPLLVVVVAVIWAVPLAVVGGEGVRLLPTGRFVPWSEVASVLEPGPGDESVRLELAGGRVLRVPGVPPGAAPVLRSVHAARR